MLTLTAEGLRKIADMLDGFGRIEAETDMVPDGGHYGYVLVSLPGDPGEALRVTRTNLPPVEGDELVGPIAYAIEIEVP